MTADLTHGGGVLTAHAADECIDITTIGRRSGTLHRTEIWFGVVDGVAYLISGNGRSADWFRNALAAGTVTVHVGGHDLATTATEVTDATLRRTVGDLMDEKYHWDGDPSIGLTRQAWSYVVPMLGLAPA